MGYDSACQDSWHQAPKRTDYYVNERFGSWGWRKRVCEREEGLEPSTLCFGNGCSTRAATMQT